VTEAELHDALDALIRKRLAKLEGLKAYLKRAMLCLAFVGGSSLATMPLEMDSDTYRSPPTRLSAQQSIVIGTNAEDYSTRQPDRKGMEKRASHPLSLIYHCRNLMGRA
jgi:hypothetical protein